MLTLLALALPIGLVVWNFMPKKSPPVEAQAEAPPELRTALETIVDKGLAPATLEGGTLEVGIQAVDTAKSARLIETAVSELGGTTLTSESDAREIRLVISVPGDRRGEFARRVELITGSPLPEAAKTAGGEPLIAITLSPAAPR